jgi:transposase-like protein
MAQLRRRIKVIGIFESIKSADRLLFLTIEALNQRRGSLPTNLDFKFTH